MDVEANALVSTADSPGDVRFTRKDLQDPVLLNILFDWIVRGVRFSYNDMVRDLQLIMGSCMCARDVYTFFLSFAADKLVRTDLYEFAVALWERYQEYSPRPHFILPPDQTIVCVWNYPAITLARYTTQPIGSNVFQVVLIPGAETNPDYPWLPVWAREKMPTIRRPFRGDIKEVYSSNSDLRGCVILCTVFRAPGTPEKWDAPIDRLVAWGSCLRKVNKLCKELGISEVHIQRQIGRYVDATMWNRYEASIHQWANKKRRIKVFIHIG